MNLRNKLGINFESAVNDDVHTFIKDPSSTSPPTGIPHMHHVAVHQNIPGWVVGATGAIVHHIPGAQELIRIIREVEIGSNYIELMKKSSDYLTDELTKKWKDYPTDELIKKSNDDLTAALMKISRNDPTHALRQKSRDDLDEELEKHKAECNMQVVAEYRSTTDLGRVLDRSQDLGISIKDDMTIELNCYRCKLMFGFQQVALETFSKEELAYNATQHRMTKEDIGRAKHSCAEVVSSLQIVEAINVVNGSRAI